MPIICATGWVMAMSNLSNLTRREFLKQATLGAAAFSFGILTARANQQEKVRLGVIGTGAQGQNLLRQLMSLPNAEVVALCDIYAPHRIGALEIAGEQTQAYRDYRALLERRDIEAVVIATPPPLARPHEHRRDAGGQACVLRESHRLLAGGGTRDGTHRPRNQTHPANRASTPL
jgi:FlaA1/EpsC-like NDP-sugar epimerase